MNVTEIFSLYFELKLSKCLNERHAFNISNGSTQFYDADFRSSGLRRNRNLRDPLHPVLYGVCDVGDHLDRLAQVISSPLLVDDTLIHFAGRNVVVSTKGDI